MLLKILFHDTDYIAIHKPAGLLVHRTNLDSQESQAAVQILRDQINTKVFPIHRLDRPTSGVLIFALSSMAASELSNQFAHQMVEKKYIALVRGHLKSEIDLDYALKEEHDKISDRLAGKDKSPQNARTLFRPLRHFEIATAVDRYPTSRYSLIEAWPKTGRKHQIRRHLKHLNHPVIGDINHGNGKHNLFFRKKYNSHRLLLMCQEIQFTHPKTNQKITIGTDLCEDFQTVINFMGY